MVDFKLDTDEQGLTKYCEQIEALAEQLAVAIDAITQNQLATLEHSIEVQQNCLAKLLPAPYLMRDVNRSSRTQQIYIRLQASIRRLVQLNKRYSALLEHTSRSLQMLQAIDPEFALTASRSSLKSKLSRSVSINCVKQPALSWHG